MDCPFGCFTESEKDGKKTRTPVRMEYIETLKAPVNWYHCVQCNGRVFEKKEAA